MSDSGTDKQREKDEALQARKEELEEELERYAQAGAFSPGLIKFTKWLSRLLYLGMAVAFMAMVFSGWGKVSEEKYQEAVQRAIDIKKTADEAKGKLAEAEGGRLVAETRARLLQNELDALKTGPAVADRAQEKARDLVWRAWGEQAAAELWREKLAHGGGESQFPDPALAARQAFEQLGKSPAGARLSLLKEMVDFGEVLVTGAALEQVKSPQPEVRAIAAMLLGRLRTEECKAALKSAIEHEQDEHARREMLFSFGLAWPGELENEYEAEAWAGFAATEYKQVARLTEAYKKAPEDRRLELLALVTESDRTAPLDLLPSVATSDRTLAERIMAVRGMAGVNSERPRNVLKALSEGDGVLAEEAKQALSKLEE